jgi:hypothetical protein
MKTIARFDAFLAVCLIVRGNRRTKCFSGALFCLAMLGSTAAAQTQGIGPIIGHIDSVVVDIGGAHVKGWACQQGRSESITVHIYANGSAHEAAKGTLVLAGEADLNEEAAVDKDCHDTIGRRHRFDIPIPGASLLKFHGMPLYVHGIRVVGNVENAAISGSGVTKFPAAPRVRQKPSSYPRLSGRYTKLSAHPRVFDTQAELKDIAKRARRRGTYSNGRYVALGERVRKDIAAKVDWESTYSGCDMEIYLRAFSYEQKPAYGNDRTEDQLRTALHGKANLAPPHGAAIVAARAALYAALVKAGAPQLPGAPSASDAAAFARRILLAWADHGFRNEKGAFRLSEKDYCDLNPDGTPHVTQFGTFVGALTLTRGVIYSVDAQDLLEGMDGLTRDENARLDGFHHNMFDTIRSIHNQEYDIDIKWKYSDEIYNNQFAGHLTALLALSRLFDDEQNFEAAVDGGSGAAAVKLPWTELFDGIIYGEKDTPWLNITPNSSVDPAESHPAYDTAIVAAGEVNDRYRHANAVQSFGYATGSLEGLYMAAEIMKNAGLDAYSYRGAHGQSLEMASRYYGCFAKSAGFEQTVTAENSRACPDAREYFGSIVNGVEPTVLIGAYRFPKDNDLAGLDGPAKATFVKSLFSIEPIMFGKWLD